MVAEMGARSIRPWTPLREQRPSRRAASDSRPAMARKAEQWTERFVVNRHRIIRQSRKTGPYIYGVYEKGLKRLWPPL